MLPWIFVVLLALNLAMLAWGYRNEHLREPPLPPVPAGQFEIRLLSEVQGEGPLSPPGPSQQTAEGLGGAPPATQGESRGAAEGQDLSPGPDLVEPAGTEDDSWVELELTGDGDEEAPPQDDGDQEETGGPPSPLLPDLAPPAEGVAPGTGPAGERPTEGKPASERAPRPTLDEREETPARGLPPMPEVPDQQRRPPGGVSAQVESTA